MDINKFLQSKNFRIALCIIGALVAFLAIFKLGVIVGYKKASFSFRWGENYHRNFGGPRNGFFQDFAGRDFVGAHGVFGQIAKIDNSTLIIKGRDDIEKIVTIKDDTVIKRFQETITLSDLKINDYVVIIGGPNDAGQIEAKFIRLLPPPRSESRRPGDLPPPLRMPI